jgi:hypothetical protein
MPLLSRVTLAMRYTGSVWPGAVTKHVSHYDTCIHFKTLYLGIWDLIRPINYFECTLFALKTCIFNNSIME